MTRLIDFRCKVLCSLGTMRSGGATRDYVQDNWLLRHKGDIVLNGTRSFRRGTRVELAYLWQGHLTRFPVRMFVLKTSTGPWDDTTAASIGCRFTLLEKWGSSDPAAAASTVTPAWYAALTDEEKTLSPLSMPRHKLFEHCVEGLGTTMSPDSLILTGNLSQTRVSMANSYVSVMADLLKSTSTYAYLDPADRVVIAKVPLAASGGPVFDRGSLFSIAPINGGETPPSRVSISLTRIRGTAGAGTLLAPGSVAPSADIIAAAGGIDPRYIRTTPVS